MTVQHQLAFMTEDEAQEAFAHRQVVVLPVGSVEQHGPHLPVATDAIIAERLSLAIAQAVDGIVLPTLCYGNSFSWSKGWISTITLAQGRLADLIFDIGQAVARKGAPCLLLFNGHGSNPPELTLGSKRLKEQFPGLEILMAEWWAAGASAIQALKETPSESHSGEFETSVMMYLAPELVRMDRLTAEYAHNLPALCNQDLIVKSGGDKIKRVQFYDPSVSSSGVYGDPRRATSAKGEAVVQCVVNNARQLVAELMRTVSHG